MGSKLVKDVIEEEYEFEIPTSMIDVVFLLLIFFMCASNFRTQEKKLDANLPKDEGLMSKPTKVEIPNEIRVKIYWANNVRTMRQWPFGQPIHSPTLALPPTVHQVFVSLEGAHIVIQVGKVQCADLNDLYAKLADLNGGAGISIVDGGEIAFTGAEDVATVQGRLTHDATFTVIVTTSLSDAGVPQSSVTVNVTSYVPGGTPCASVGVHVKTPVAGTKVAPLGRPVSESVSTCTGSSASVAVTVNWSCVSSSTD